MTTTKSAEAANLGAQDDGAGSGVDVVLTIRQPDDSRGNLADDLSDRLDRLEMQFAELGWLP